MFHESFGLRIDLNKFHAIEDFVIFPIRIFHYKIKKYLFRFDEKMLAVDPTHSFLHFLSCSRMTFLAV